MIPSQYKRLRAATRIAIHIIHKRLCGVSGGPEGSGSSMMAGFGPGLFTSVPDDEDSVCGGALKVSLLVLVTDSGGSVWWREYDSEVTLLLTSNSVVDAEGSV